MAAESGTKQIPQPPTKLFLGNLGDVDPEYAIQSMAQLINRYGEIVKLSFPGREIVLAGSRDLVHELCDQTRFEKVVRGALEEVRSVAGDGLFTARGEEDNWKLAHRILMPAFGPLSIRNMLPGMVDICSQLVAKWHRFGDERIDVVDDFTRLTLDTIALCTFSHRFNSFYSESAPPFVAAMSRSLKAAGLKIRRLPGTSWLYGAADRQFAEDVALQHHIADELVAERQKSGEDKGDLLDVMLKGRDPKTGAGLSPENIRYQLVTFLIAGHETTSGMLSFLFHYLLRDPEVATKIRREVDEVCGTDPVTFDKLQKLKYIDAALKETLRLKSTAPAFSVAPTHKDETVCGQYVIPKDTTVVVVLDSLHRDPKIWGEDAEEFRPERMLDGKFEALPANSWKPFGNGMRGCIGRPFAWQESLLVVATLFQHFDFRPDNTSYQLEIKTALTIKPAGLYMHASPRKTAPPVSAALGADTAGYDQKQTSESNVVPATDQNGPPLAIYYGSNAGTCKALAHKLSDAASRRGCKVSVGHLNDVASGSLPNDKPVAIITASYEGQPTDDANLFYEWIKNAKSDETRGIKFGVFGCHPDWAATYHAIPTSIDKRMEECGGTRLVERGEGNAAGADLFETFDDWEELFLAKVSGSSDASNKAHLEATVDGTARTNMLGHGDMQSASVISNEIITHGGVQIKRHIALQMPEGTAYRAGDYLALLPINPKETVRRVLQRFSIHADDLVKLQGSGMSFLLPTEFPISAFDLFSGFVELGQPVSSKQIKALLEMTQDDDEKKKLGELSEGDIYEREVLHNRMSLLDILEEYPSVEMPLGDFILALPALRLRQYSISSSPLDDVHRVTLTISVLKAKHFGSDHRGTFLGTATNYLASLEPGTRIRAVVRPAQPSFHLPADPKTPIIMAGAGSGIAPFRAFLQERALQKESGRDVGPALLFFGCRSPSEDALYDKEIAAWQDQGIVTVRYAFSACPEESKGAKHVQDRIYLDREEAAEFFGKGAKVFICGSKPLALGITATCQKIYSESTGKSEAESKDWFESIQADRFATDVFG